MNISVGIVGLPNVGKSTLFNALTNSTVEAQNYPFCTIEPNKGIVPIADERVDRLVEVVDAKRKVNAVIEFVDIAGLVKGAAQGAGLGNQFLANIREVAVIAHVVRSFEDGDVIHVEGKVDPKSDIETIEMELIIKDIETVQNKIDSLKSKARSDKATARLVDWLESLLAHLESGKYAILFDSGTDEEVVDLREGMFLLTDKPQIYIVNKKDGEESNVDFINKEYPAIEMDIKLEYELSQLSVDERAEYVEEFNLKYTGLERLAKTCYELLGLIYYFTAGEMEVRAWTIEKGDSMKKAAGAIHTDFEKNFIAADVVAYKDFVESNGWLGSKDDGKVRLEGKEYTVVDGDVVLIKHN